MNKILNRVIQGDCLEVMKQISDKSVDLILTDPPYNAKSIGPKNKKYKSGQMQLPLPEYIKFCQLWFTEARRISKRMVFTPGIANVCYYPQPDWIACWHKPAACSYNRFGGYNAWEPIMLYGKLPKGKRLLQDYILYNTLNLSKGLEKGHPCPKPLPLIEYLINIFSAEHELVGDPFMGSGRTAIACIKYNRNFWGCEKVKEYCDLTNRCITQELSQTDMFRTIDYTDSVFDLVGEAADTGTTNESSPIDNT